MKKKRKVIRVKAIASYDKVSAGALNISCQ